MNENKPAQDSWHVITIDLEPLRSGERRNRTNTGLSVFDTTTDTVVCDLFEHEGSHFQRFDNDETNARLIAETPALLKALNAACGYLINAKIDLETGATKATAIRTIDGGLKMIREALAKATS